MEYEAFCPNCKQKFEIELTGTHSEYTVKCPCGEDLAFTLSPYTNTVIVYYLGTFLKKGIPNALEDMGKIVFFVNICGLAICLRFQEFGLAILCLIGAILSPIIFRTLADIVWTFRKIEYNTRKTFLDVEK